ncbi:MAG: CBS domain-containing protein [Gammaproteobacteria bacterium]|nr:CBS domain-containing protein [Gammaproteobacteria bacterium]
MLHSSSFLPAISLQPQSTFGRRARGILVVKPGSPANTVLTDFAYVTPVTTTPQATIDAALRKMKATGVRLLFVVNDIDEIVGLVTTTDIIGERPIKVAQQTRLPRTKLTVASIMTPQSDIQVLDADRVNAATVGDIADTLRMLGRQHALVAKLDPATDTHQVIGMFSTSNISRMLGHDLPEQAAPACSLAEVVEKIS